MSNRYPWRLLACIGLLFASALVSADSWRPPQREVTLSDNGRYRVTVVPRPLGGAAAFFRDKVEGVAPAGQRRGEAQVSPIARVEQLTGKGVWRLLWQMPLVNDVGPTSVLLANDASFLVTFDNWHSVGFGDDVIAIYDRKGELVRKLSLDQVLPPAYVHHLPRSVSSRWWGNGHALVQGDRLVELRIVIPGARMHDDSSRVPVRVRLADGAVIPPSGAAWESAMAKATTLESQRLAAWEALRKQRAAPLPTPVSRDTQEWRRYGFELRDRIAVEDESMGVMVLPAPGEEPGFQDAQDIADWIGGYDDKEPYSGKSFVLVSPTSDLLAALLVKSLRARPERSMKNAHIVFVGTAAEGEQVRNAANRPGAKVSVVDRAASFPPGEGLPASPPPLWSPPPARF